MKRHTKKQGFTLVEIVIAVSIVILLSALSIHGLLRARMAANESAAVRNLKALQTAFASYRIVNPNYPLNLARLNAQNPPYVDAALAQGTKQGYTFKIIDTQANTFRLAALPVKSGITGNKVFVVDENGTITEAGSNIVAAGILNTYEVSAFGNLLTLYSQFQNYRRRYGIYPSSYYVSQGGYTFSIVESSNDSFLLAADSSDSNNRSFTIDQNGGISQPPPPPPKPPVIPPSDPPGGRERSAGAGGH